ncbi:MAG TPA: cytochrome c peroxidase [Anaeromyxobacteraceae bacterium]|nr:cytochrome c peroxidase [Anaeromyxobacteraceae bacterium]
MLTRLALLVLAALASTASAATPPWERDNPAIPFAKPPLGMEVDWSESKVRLTPEKVRLGRWLFYDPRLSADGTVSCASCHRPEHAFSEPTPTSTGIRGQKGARKAPSIVNVAFATLDHYFWDGRASSLAEQAKGPIANPVEMGTTHAAVVATLTGIAGYRAAFAAVYGDGPIDIDRVADAIAAYETTRLSGGSAYDRWVAGDQGALSEKALAGREIFFGRGQCSECHSGRNFSDGRFHVVGVGWTAPPEGSAAPGSFADPGRFAVTKDPADLGAFKTPGLRDVSKHAPYMHDGSARNLEDAVRVYVHRPDAPNLARQVAGADLNCNDVAPVAAFLRALDGTGYEDQPPASFPR